MTTLRDDHHCCDHTPSSSVTQTLDELDFERGVWSAALNGETVKVIKFIEGGGDPDIVDNAGYTALHYSSRHGKTDVVSVLLHNGANPNCTTRSGGVTPLHRAAYSGHTDIVKMLLKAMASPLLCDEDNKSPLHKSAERGHLDICKLLVAADGTLVELKDKRGKLPVDYVVESNVSLKSLLQVR